LLWLLFFIEVTGSIDDPSQKLVEEYIKRGQCFVAEVDDSIIGAMFYYEQDLRLLS
jgi:hypothetical protein